MQEAKNETVKASGKTAALQQVTFYINDKVFLLSGHWDWELHSDAVFCSDVMMAWPPDFAGTKGIVHPDDKPSVTEALDGLKEAQTAALNFRLITTYGEIKTLRGKGLSLSEAEETFDPAAALSSESSQRAEAAKGLRQAEWHRTAYAQAGRVLQAGIWHHNASTGETWYSDEAYRILGLPPQSLNAHLNTLYPFIHNDDRKDVIEALEQSFIRQVPLHLQFRISLPNNGEKWVESVTSHGFNSRGETMIYGLLQNITPQKEQEQRCDTDEATLSFQKQLLHFAESAIGIGYWQVNLVTKKIIYSDNHYRIFGLKPQDGPATAFVNLIHPDDRDVYSQLQQKIRKEHTAPEVDYRIVRPDGKTRYIRQKGKAIITGAEILMVGTVQDITVQKGLEKKLADLQERIEVKAFTAAQAEGMAGIGTWVWNLQTQEVRWSDNFYELVGIKPNVAFTQKMLVRAVHPDDQKLFNDELSLLLQERQETAFTFRLLRRGEVRHMRASFKIMAYNGLELFIGTVQDLTSERLMLQSLNERIHLIELLADTIPDQVFVTDADHNIVLWNRKSEEVYGRKREKVVGENFFDALPALKQEDIVQRLTKVLGGEEVRLHNQKGAYVLRGWFNMTHIPLKDETGSVNGILHLIHDVTAEHQLHHQLTTRLHFIEQLLEFSVDRVVALDRNMNYLYWNKRAEEEYGLSKEGVIGKNILELFPQTEAHLSYADFRRALRGETVYIPATEELPEESHLVPVKDDRGDVTAVLWVQHDRKKDFLLRVQSQKAFDIVNALNENYLELDREYRVAFVNKNALAYFEKEEAEVRGKVLWEVYPQMTDTPLHIALVHAMEERVVVRKEFKSPLYNIELLVSIAPTADGIAVAFSDISFIKEAEQKLAEEHRRFQEAQAIGAIGSFEWNFGDELVTWSDEMYRICNLEPQSERITVDRSEQLVWPEDLPKLMALKESFYVTPGHYELQHRILLDDGTLKWVTQRFESLADEAGNVVRVHGTLQDVTESLKAERELKESKDLLQTVFDASPNSISVFEILYDGQGAVEDFKILIFNPYTLKTIGNRDVIGQRYAEAFPHVKETGVLDAFKNVAATGEPADFERWYEGEGMHHWFRFIANKVGNLLLVTTEDITERKTAELKVKRSKELLQDIIDAPNIGIAVYKAVRNEKGKVVDFVHEYINRTSISLLSGEDFTGRLFTDHGENALLQMPQLVQAIETGERNAYTREAPLHGRTFWFAITNTPLDGDRLVHTWEDVTESKKAAEELLRIKEERAQQATDKYELLFNSIDEGFCIVEVLFDEEGRPHDYRFLEANPAFEKQTGLTNALGKTMKALAPAHEQHWFEIYGRIAKTGVPERFEQEAKAINHYYEVYAFRTGAPQEHKIAILFKDISERKHREAALAFLAEISQDLVRMTKPEETLEILGEKIGVHFNSIRTSFVEIFENENKAIVQEWHRPELSNIAGEYPLSQFLGEAYRQKSRAGETVVVPDIHKTSLVDGPQLEEVFGIRSFINIPLVRKGQWVFTLGIHDAVPRAWRDDEIELLQELTARIWARLEKARAEEALTKSEEKYRSLFENIDEGFAVVEVFTNKHGCVVDLLYSEANEAFGRHSGMHDFIGKKVSEMFPGLEQHWLDMLTRVYQTGDNLRMENSIAELGRWLDVHYSRIGGPGSPLIAVVFNDVTERKQREQQQDFLLRLSDTLRTLPNKEAIENTSLQLLAGFLNLDRTYIATVYRTEDRAVIGPEYLRPGLGLVPVLGELRMSDFPEGFRQVEEQTLVVDNIATDETLSEPDRQSLGAINLTALVVASVRRGGTNVVWSLVASTTTPRKWTAGEILLIETVAGRTWAAAERTNAEEALRQSEARQRALLEEKVKERTEDLQKNLAILNQAEDIAAIGSWEYYIPSGRFTWSDGMYRIFGRPPGSPVEPEVYVESAAPEDKAVAKRIVKNLRSRHKPFDETICISRGGSQRLLKVKATLVNDEEGRPLKMVGVDLDVTDLMETEQKLRAQRYFAETIFDASIDQMTVFDKNLRFLAWNKRSEEIGGLKKEAVIGKTIFEVFPTVKDDADFMEAQAKALAGEYAYIPAKRGIYSKNFQQWFYVPLKNERGETYAVLNIIHDMNDEVEAEEKLKQQNRELEAKNEEITNFAFIASHDLKEPIRKIYTFSNWLMEREAEGLSAKGKEYAFKIFNAVKRLDSLINDIGTLTKLQAIKETPSEVNLNLVLTEARAELQEVLDESGAVIESKSLPVIAGHRKQLVHLFRNLIANAVKFQQPDVVPVVEIACEKKTDVQNLPHGEWYELKFTDNGIGFDMQYAEKIFGVFQRLHGQSQYPGTGIGLAICKKIMENHGGDIKAESQPGKGSVFCCYFPAFTA